MPIVFLYYCAAGAAFIGGPAVGSFLFRRGRQEAALSEQRREADMLKQALRLEIDLQDLREEARKAGIDPEAVVEGYRAFKSGQLTLEQVLSATPSL